MANLFDSHDPIIGERRIRLLELLSLRMAPQAGTATVLMTGAGGLRLVDGRGPVRSERGASWRLATLYEVDLGLHQFESDSAIQSADQAFPFRGTFTVQWRVIDPLVVVREQIRNVKALIELLLAEVLKPIGQRFSVDKVHDAELAINEASSLLEDACRSFGIGVRLHVLLTADSETLAHIRQVREIERQVEIESRNQILRSMQAMHHQELLLGRVEFFRAIVLAGDLDQFALHLAQNPADVLTVITMVREERAENRRQTTDFIARLLDSGLIDRSEIDEQVRTALLWLKESSDRVVRPGGPRFELNDSDAEMAPNENIPPIQASIVQGPSIHPPDLDRDGEISLAVYLDTADSAVSERVFNAVAELADYLGYEVEA